MAKDESYFKKARGRIFRMNTLPSLDNSWSLGGVLLADSKNSASEWKNISKFCSKEEAEEVINWELIKLWSHATFKKHQKTKTYNLLKFELERRGYSLVENKWLNATEMIVEKFCENALNSRRELVLVGPKALKPIAKKLKSITLNKEKTDYDLFLSLVSLVVDIIEFHDLPLPPYEESVNIRKQNTNEWVHYCKKHG